MNVLNKIKPSFSSLFLFILFLPLAYSFNVCNVEVSESNAFIVKENITNKDVLIVDSDGDIYLEGQNHVLINNATEKSFQVGTAFFNRVTSKFNSFLQDLGSVPTDNSLVIQNNVGTNVASFSNTGNIYTKGKGVYESGQAGCQADGNYCNVNIVENRDNYCDLTGSKTGMCAFSVISSEDCGAKLSIDTDGGINYNLAGTVTDYTSCSSGSCTNISYADSCSGKTLTEYLTLGASYSTSTKNCAVDNTLYCSGTNVWTTNYLCGSGACFRGSDSLLQSCVATATSYGSWSCSDINTKIRTNTVYSPQCSSGSCVSNYNPTATPEIVDCPINNVCIGGTCSLVTCTLDGVTKYVGESYTFFSSVSPSGSSCSSISQTRTCQISGSFDGNSIYNKASCSSGCSLSGVSLTNAQSYTFYSVSSSYSCTSNSQSRTCTDGTLGGSSSYNLASCTTKVDCVGYWNLNAGSCSASCGNGNYDKQWVTTTSPQNGGVQCPAPSWYDNAGNICNLGACYIYHYEKRCVILVALGGTGTHVFWYDSLGVKQDKQSTCCSSSCTNGVCGSCSIWKSR